MWLAIGVWIDVRGNCPAHFALHPLRSPGVNCARCRQTSKPDLSSSCSYWQRAVGGRFPLRASSWVDAQASSAACSSSLQVLRNPPPWPCGQLHETSLNRNDPGSGPRGFESPAQRQRRERVVAGWTGSCIHGAALPTSQTGCKWRGKPLNVIAHDDDLIGPACCVVFNVPRQGHRFAHPAGCAGARRLNGGVVVPFAGMDEILVRWDFRRQPISRSVKRILGLQHAILNLGRHFRLRETSIGTPRVEPLASIRG